MSKKKPTGQIIVKVRCVVDKELVCEGGTEEQVRANPWHYAIDERELEQITWDVMSVKVDRP